MFEQSFKNIDNELHNDAGCSTEMDYIDLAKMVINNIEVALESTKQEDSENYEDRLHS